MTDAPTDETIEAVLAGVYGSTWLNVHDKEIEFTFLRLAWPLIATQVHAEASTVATWLRHDADRIHDWTPDGVAIRLRHYADRLDGSAADPEAGT